MPTKYVHTSIEGRALKLSNLEKVLYPSIKVTKAEVIQYYLHIAPHLLRYIRDRPLTVIRFPDGIDGKSFYSKDKPKWTPEWISSMKIQHEEKIIDYIVTSEKASIIWLANLACLELHPTQFLKSNDKKPDFFVVDLDPDEGLGFSQVKEAALHMRDFLRRYDYTSYLKTSGGKGLHLYIPILPEVNYDILTESIKSLTRIFISQYKNLYTLNISKAQRKGKILIDIYRNHLSNTTVAPFSLRGRTGAPVSMPIAWEQLDIIDRSSYFTIKNYQTQLEEHGDVWAEWRKDAVSLHDQKVQHVVSLEDDGRLKDYIDKRDFKKTVEPSAAISLKFKDQYVIQLHDASNLHYDLRLEDNGVLLSWAIPKGLPFLKDQKRLAIRTEDHPIKYLDFEGIIPKGQYGAGEMWVLKNGNIEWHKKSPTSYKFTLTNKADRRTYNLYQTSKSEQWLIESTGNCEFHDEKKRIDPMLASASRSIPKGSKFSYEVKWDGIRVLIYYQNEEVKIVSRGGREISDRFPELQIPDFCKVEHAVFDAEIVVLDEKGRPLFHEVISRMHTKGENSILRASQVKPVTCYIFDLVSIDGHDIVYEPLKRRRSWLETILIQGTYYRMSVSFGDGQQLFDAIELQGMEGIMAKNLTSRYLPGKRSDSWVKIKCRKLEQCLIIGFTEGQGDRSGLFGAMHLAKRSDEGLKYMGKVGTGYNHEMLKSLVQIMSTIERIKKPIVDKIEEERKTVWIKPILSCEIEFASLSSNGTYREPVFIKLNEEL